MDPDHADAPTVYDITPLSKLELVTECMTFDFSLRLFKTHYSMQVQCISEHHLINIYIT